MRFELKALRGDERPSALTMEAADSADATMQALAQGYTVLTIKARQPWLAWYQPRKTKFPLLLFSQELLALLDAGLALVESLETLAEKELRPEVKRSLQQIVGSLYEGHTLSYALRHNSARFPPLYVASVHASEKTGALAEALTRYIGYQTQMDSVRRQVVSASIYPLLLMGVGGLVVLFLMFYVVPRFSHIYADIGGELPLMSRLLMGWGRFIGAHSVVLSGTLLAACALLLVLLTRPRVKQWLLQSLWRIPAIGGRLHLYQLARFYRSLGMLLRGGMPVVSALQMTAELLQQSLHQHLARAAQSIREGLSISLAMERHGLTTPVALRMLRVGERTGRMGEMMERTASFYEEDMARWVERFTKLFEPLLMVVIGLFIGGIVVLMYFPIFELAGSLQ